MLQSSDEEAAALGALAIGSSMEGLRLRPGLAMSQDGRNWARIEADHHTGALFDVGAEGEWDELFIGAPQVGFGGAWGACVVAVAGAGYMLGDVLVE